MFKWNLTVYDKNNTRSKTRFIIKNANMVQSQEIYIIDCLNKLIEKNNISRDAEIHLLHLTPLLINMQ